MKTDRLYRSLKLLALALLGVAVMACGGEKPEPEPEPVQPDITVDASSLDVFSSGIRVEAEPPGGFFTKEIVFTTTDKWTATISEDGSASWISVSPSSGAAGKATMTVTVTSNDSESERRAEVKITCGSVSKSFSVVQDGKAPPVVFNLSAPSSSGISVVSYDYDDGTLIIETTEDKLPKPGDIVCSGITEEAPYGFLFQIESVERVSSTKASGIRTKIVGGSVELYLIFKLLGISDAQWYPLKEVEAECHDDEGHSIYAIEENKSKVFPFDLTIEPVKDTKLTFGMKFAVRSLRLYLDTTSPNLVVGFDAAVRNTLYAHLTAEGKKEIKGDVLKESSLLNPTVIHSYEFAIAGIPIVVTTKYKPTMPYELSLSGKVDMDLFNKSYYSHIGCLWHTITNDHEPVEGAPDYFYQDDDDDEAEQLDFPSQDFSMTLNGTASFGVDFEYSVGLYGGNIFDESIDALVEAFALDPKKKISAKYLSIGANAGIKIKNEATLGAMINLAEDSHNAVRVIDDNKFTSYFYGKLWGTLFKWKKADLVQDNNKDKPKEENGYSLSVLSGEVEMKVLKTEFHFPYFIPSYSKLKLKDVTRQEFIQVSGRRHKPLFRFFHETGYGFCLESADGSEYYVFDATSVPIDKKDHILKFDIPMTVDHLRRGVKYSIYPYSTISNFFSSTERMICREGISFVVSDDGQMSTGVIDDIPGENL